MATSIEERLAALQQSSKAELCSLWKVLLGTSPPGALRRELLIRILAYAMQAQAFGALADRTRQRLRELAQAVGTKSGVELSTTAMLQPGTRLVREWRQQKHLVRVEKEGFEYKGDYYDSLSKIARVITGTHWSGPLFFGLKSKSNQTLRSVQ